MSFASLSKKFKRSIFEILVKFLRKSASLKSCAVSINVGEVVYLDNIGKIAKEKDTLVLIHGLGADKDTWLQLAKYLTNNYRIIIPDLPGHGESTQEYSLDYSVASQAKSMLELLKSLNIGCAHFIGSSMGGAVATWIAYMRPEDVKTLILIDSYGAIKTPGYIYKLAEKLGYNPMLKINNVDDYKKMMSLAMVNPPFVPGFMLDVLAENMEAKVKINNKIFKDSGADSDLTSILPQVKAPSLVIWGAEDKVLHVDNSDVFVQKLQRCTKVILEKAGHVPMVEYPRIVAGHIKRFINEISHAGY